MAILFKSKAPYILLCALFSSSVLLSTGCSRDEEDKSAEQGNTVSSLLEQTTAVATSAIDSAQAVVENSAVSISTVVEEAETVVKETAEAASSVAEEVKTAVVEKTVVAKEAVTNATVVVAGTVVEPKEDVPTSIDGGKIYANCSGCHGTNGSGGVGPALNSQTTAEIVNKLQRYKMGEQVGPMSGMMQPIAKALSDTEIHAVAKYATSLK